MFVAFDNDGVDFWASNNGKTLRGMFNGIALPAMIEEAEVLDGQTVVIVGDRTLFYK